MGKLFVIEGLDASGKATQTEILAKRLKESGYKVRVISFPDYESDGSMLVRRYLDGTLGTHPDDTNAFAASVFFGVDRYYSFTTDWKKDYADPSTVILANRYTTANAYHQISKRPQKEWDGFLSWLWDFEFDKMGLPRPDHVICLEMPPELSRRLLAERCEKTGVQKDIHEADDSYLDSCHEAALYVADKMNWTVIPCSENGEVLSREAIAEKVYASFLPYLES